MGLRSLLRKPRDEDDADDAVGIDDSIDVAEPAESRSASRPQGLPPASTPPWLVANGKRSGDAGDRADAPERDSPNDQLRQTYESQKPAPEQPLRTQEVRELLKEPAVVEGYSQRYVTARREWDERVDKQVRRERLWQYISFGCMAVTAVSVIGCVVLSGRMTIVPHIVEVDREGTVVASYNSNQLRSNLNEQIVRALITQWIVAFRTVTVDRSMQTQLLTKVESFLPSGSQAHSRVASVLRQSSPYQAAQSVVIYPEVEEVRRVGADSWYVIWIERITPRTGGHVTTKKYTASLVTGRGAIDASRMAWNPLGLYILELDFTNTPTSVNE